ncbi:MAG: AAA family ATPase [Chitinispirillaceae bacterium]|nr:AAA family ATPase [Chitinispirillaceae bacterium]
MSYLDHWHLREKPFEELCDTRFFFESEDHREALDRMLYVVNDRNMNMGLLTGEIGSGKTITKHVLIGSLPSQQFATVDFENSNFSFMDLLFDTVTRLDSGSGHKNAAVETPQRNDKYQLMQLFKKRLETLFYEEKKHLVILFDEAQQIGDTVIDEIKNLTNISSRSENFLTIFFVGQPELREKVKRMRQVDQRIFLRFHLNNLDYNGTVKYIQHRLRVAGHDMNTLFTTLGYELIFRSSGGVPREINRLCKLVLNYGFAHDLAQISREDIQVILEDIEKQG